MGYSRIPTASNEDGHLSLEINKKESLVREQQQGLVDALHKCLGSKPTLIVCIEGIKPLPEDRFVVTLCFSLFVLFVVMFGINTTSDISKLLYLIS